MFGFMLYMNMCVWHQKRSHSRKLCVAFVIPNKIVVYIFVTVRCLSPYWNPPHIQTVYGMLQRLQKPHAMAYQFNDTRMLYTAARAFVSNSFLFSVFFSSFHSTVFHAHLSAYPSNSFHLRHHIHWPVFCSLSHSFIHIVHSSNIYFPTRTRIPISHKVWM